MRVCAPAVLDSRSVVLSICVPIVLASVSIPSYERFDVSSFLVVV